MKRKLLITLGLLCVLGLVWATVRRGLRYYAERAITGRLSFDSTQVPAQSFAIGAFTAHWSTDNGGQLTLTAPQQNNKIVWQSVTGAGFVAAAQGTETVTDSRGMFFIADKLQTVCAAQSVNELQAVPDALTVKGRLTCDDNRTTDYALIFKALTDKQLQFTLTLSDARLNRTYLTYASDAGEHFFGLGEQFSYFDFKGRRVPLFVMEQGIGRGLQPLTAGADWQAGAGGDWHTTYAGVPYYLTNRLRALWLETSEYAVFDFRTADRVQLQLFAPALQGRLMVGDSPAQIVEEYTSYAGRMKPLPDWLNRGAVIGMQGGTDKVRTVYAQLKAQQIPVAAFWLQDWVGPRTTTFGQQLWWNWELDRTRYPHWEELRDDLARDGVRVMVYVNPFLADVAAKPNAQRNLYREAVAAGYLVKRPDGAPYLIQNTSFSAGLLDLTQPAARDWFTKVMQANVLGIGASGWMADFGEALPYDAQLGDEKISAAKFHNLYPEAWAQLNREITDNTAQDRAQTASQRNANAPPDRAATSSNSTINNLSANPDELVFFMRSGYTRSPNYAKLFWTGDQLVSWDAQDGLKTTVTALLSSGLSGYSLNHSDIGGYTTITNPLKNYHRSPELLMRWMELNAFTATFRTHEGNRPADNAQIYDNAELLAHFARCAKIYAALAPYRRQLMDEAATHGWPLVRPLFFHYPADERTYTIDYQEFMLGSEILVAPVLEAGATRVKVYLPSGSWTHLWTKQQFDALANNGLEIEIDAPLGQPAVFYRTGSATLRNYPQIDAERLR